MSMAATALAGLATLVALFTVVWAVGVARRDASLVDRIWGAAFVVAAWVYLGADAATGPRGLLVAGLVTLWGLRLSAHLTWRNWGEGEDARYAEMRRRRPDGFAVRSLVNVYLLQAVLAWLVSAPLLAVAVAGGRGSLTWLDALASAVFAVGFALEVVADVQLARFRADPANAGRVLDTGVWAASRHPNYFGDTVVWWSFGLFAVAAGSWWALLGPALMTVLIVKVSGVALTDRRMAHASSRAGYDAYVARTNAFVPGRVRRSQ